MNILYTNIHRGDGGGHATYIRALLQNPEHTKYVACPSSSTLYKTLQEEGYDKLIPIDFPGKPRHIKEIFTNCLLFRKTIIQHNIDIVHTNGSNDNRMALYIMPTMPKRFKVVHTKHNAYTLKNFSSQLRFKWFNAATIFVGDIVGYLGLQQDFPKYHIIPNGIDLQYWKRTKPIQTSSRLRLISNAGASKHKGWQHLMEAIEGLEAHEKERLSVVMLARHEEDMAKELAAAPHICSFSRPGFFKDTRPYLEDADIGFVLSYKEACSFACREMMAMSLPVITSDFKALTNNINEDCGWVTQARDAASIRAVLRSILAMPPEQLNAMKLAARKKAEADFAIQDMIEQTNKVYASVANQ